MIVVRVQAEDFDYAAEMAALRMRAAGAGALVGFTGLMRDMHDGARLTAMTLEHYPGMAERQLTELAQTAAQRWPLLGITILHRHGRLTPGDQIVLVGTASAHRQAAFEAAQFLMDWLKTKAPFWKLEESQDRRHWVAAHSTDVAAAERWE
ncbi:MAG: molybdenum cofactor biosynthesis protein MoaE [Sphingomonadales bacterium]|nr:MAG: molybdenum cofactor biosynthesis protein MoaE [Sphingomonadales bacterium]